MVALKIDSNVHDLAGKSSQNQLLHNARWTCIFTGRHSIMNGQKFREKLDTLMKTKAKGCLQQSEGNINENVLTLSIVNLSSKEK